MSEYLTAEERLVARGVKEAQAAGICQYKIEKIYHMGWRALERLVNLLDQEEKEKDGYN